MWHNLMEAKWEPKKVTVFKMFRHVSRNFNPSNPNIHRHLPISDCRMLFSKYQVWFAPVWHLHNTGRQALHHLPRFSYPLKVQRCKPAKKPAQLSGFTALSLSRWSLGLETRIVVPRTTSFFGRNLAKNLDSKKPRNRGFWGSQKTQQGLTLRKQINSWGQKIVFKGSDWSDLFGSWRVPTVPTDFLPGLHCITLSESPQVKTTPAFRISGIIKDRAKAGGAKLPFKPRYGKVLPPNPWVWVASQGWSHWQQNQLPLKQECLHQKIWLLWWSLFVAIPWLFLSEVLSVPSLLMSSVVSRQHIKE